MSREHQKQDYLPIVRVDLLQRRVQLVFEVKDFLLGLLRAFLSRTVTNNTLAHRTENLTACFWATAFSNQVFMKWIGELSGAC